ncbi:MAG: hypothetical protein ACRD2L_02415 [Terriglobia bacterium]
MPLLFLLAALLIIGLIEGDLWVAFTRFGTLSGMAKAGCLFAIFAGLVVALLRD